MASVSIARLPDDPDAEYVGSPEVEAVAQALIGRHGRFDPLLPFRIAYLERLGPPSGEGESILAKVQKAPAVWRDVAGVDLVVWVWRAVWTELEPRQREALVAHELCHVFVTDKGSLKLQPHDLEEFSWVVRQYGPWKLDIEHFGRQLRAFDENGAPTKARITAGDRTVETDSEELRRLADEPIRLPAGRERRRPGSRQKPDEPPVVHP